MSTGMKRLYQLLPELYRWRDESNNLSLEAFLAVIEEEFAQLEEDMGATYDNWFIETCDSWVVPYIAELLGVRDVAHGEHLPFTQRRRVANTLAYRRRKGTISVLEQVMWDVTNWHVRAVEFHRLTAVSQHIRHRSANAGRSMDLRSEAGAMDVGGPLSAADHTADIRTIQHRVADALMEAETARPALARAAQHDSQGKFNLNNIGLFFWRLRSYPVTNAWPMRVGKGRFTLHPSGRDTHLFNRPQPFREISQRAERVNLPVPLTRQELDDDIRSYRARYRDESSAPAPGYSRYYGTGRSLFLAFDGAPILPASIVSVDLSGWSDATAEEIGIFTGRTALVDPELGRVMIVESDASGSGTVAVDGTLVADYTYGFSGDIGGGPYPRPVEVDVGTEPFVEIHVDHSFVADNDPNKPAPKDWTLAKWHEQIVGASSVTAALELWEQYCRRVESTELKDRPKPRGVIRIMDNFVYSLDAMGPSHDTNQSAPARVTLPESAELTIVAETGVQPALRIGGSGLRIVFELPSVAARAADVSLTGMSTLEELPPVSDRRLHLNGLLLIGSLSVLEPADPGALNMMDLIMEECTLVEGEIAATMESSAAALDVQIVKSIVGPIRLPAQVAGLTITDSIVDRRLGDPQHRSAVAIGGVGSGAGPLCRLERCTIFGAVHVRELALARATVWTDRIVVDDTQRGRVEFCYIPAGSTTPPGDECLCADASAGRNIRNPTIVTPPTFTSQRYGHPGYAQISTRHSVPAYMQIAGNGAEIGVFHDLYQPQREANIRQVLDRYLPLGLRAGLFYVT